MPNGTGFGLLRGRAAPLVSNALWAIIEPLISPEPPKPKGGRPRLDDRAALTGILFVLRSGIPWELLPMELGRGSGMTCWRRLHDWDQAGVWGAGGQETEAAGCGVRGNATGRQDARADDDRTALPVLADEWDHGPRRGDGAGEGGD